MELNDIYTSFPTQRDCILHLERALWADGPTCPYCKSGKHSAMPRENRYHCNSCNKSYSVTVNTLFHKSKIDLQKWFYAFMILMNTKDEVSARKLAASIKVTKDSAWYMLRRIKKAVEEGFTI
jgi:transposase-like protein